MINIVLFSKSSIEFDIPQNKVEVFQYDGIYEDLFIENEFDVLIIDMLLSSAELEMILIHSHPYTIFYTENAITDDHKASYTNTLNKLQKLRFLKLINKNHLNDFINSLPEIAHDDFIGGRRSPAEYIINKSFCGKICYEGNYKLIMKGNFGENLTQCLHSSFIFDCPAGLRTGVWLEIIAKGNIHIEVHVRISNYVEQYGSGKLFVYKYAELDKTIEYLNKNSWNQFMTISICACGYGEINLGHTHYRRMRGKHARYGYHILGSEIIRDNHKQELECYFNPSDGTGPLNVYFAGYRTAEGFEGAYMMRNLRSPYILVADPRLEGGAFYVGSQELEQKLVKYIKEKLNYLNLTSNDLIVSGLSMGAFGAQYYGLKLNANYIILGKPLSNIYDIADNNRFINPSGFPTALDVVLMIKDLKQINDPYSFNDIIYKIIREKKNSNTKFAVIYMKNDEYDSRAFNRLILELADTNMSVYARSFRGRHNQNTNIVVNNFIEIFKDVLNKEYCRDFDK